MYLSKLRLLVLFLFLCIVLWHCSRSDGPIDAGRYRPEVGDGLEELPQKWEDPVGPRSYRVLQMGAQQWLGDNLFTVVANSWCYEEHRKNCGTYGRIYTAEAARYACRGLGEGWRLPTLEEWKKLLSAYGGYVAENGAAVGPSPEAARINLTNPNLPFRAQIGGIRTIDGAYQDEQIQTFYWTSTELGDYTRWYALVVEEMGIGFRVVPLPKKAGGYCRCIRDQTIVE